MMDRDLGLDDLPHAYERLDSGLSGAFIVLYARRRDDSSEGGLTEQGVGYGERVLNGGSVVMGSR